MFSRVQNRNTGYSENLFSHNPRIENNTIGSIDGATALKLDENYQLEDQEQNKSINYTDNKFAKESFTKTSIENEQETNDLPSGVSIESASYMENNKLDEYENSSFENENNEAEYTPKLFSEDDNYLSDENTLESDNKINNETDQLFDQDINEEEDFEIPAFLRKQKF